MIRILTAAFVAWCFISTAQAQILSDEELLRMQQQGQLGKRTAPTGDTSVFPTNRARQERPSENGSIVGPLRDPKTGIRGSIINNEGDSARGLWRINRNRTKYLTGQAAAWPNANEVDGTFRRDRYWFSDGYFWDSELHPNRKVTHDAWTHDTGNAIRRSFVVSCVVNKDNENMIKFFMTSHVPINNLGAPTRVWVDIGGDGDVELPRAKVSPIYVGNVHAGLTLEEAKPIIDRLREAAWVEISIQTVQGVIQHRTRYSLYGFTAASNNLYTECFI